MSCMIKDKMRAGLLVSMFLGVFALQAAAISGGSDAGTLKLVIRSLAYKNKNFYFRFIPCHLLYQPFGRSLT